MSVASHWPIRTVDDLCLSIVDCVNRTAPVVEGPTPFRMIRTTNVQDGFVDLTETRFVDEGVFQAWTRRQMPEPGDIILTREAPLGEVGLLRGGCLAFLGQRLVSYRANPDLLDNRYLLYYLRSEQGRAQVLALGSGSTVHHMRVPEAKRLQIPTPPVDEQRRIGAILGTYDDLIAVNRQRVALLEDMARRLFEEWFVRFRFPGHDSAAMVETPDGPVPEGWAWLSADRLLDFDPRTQVPRVGAKPFVSMAHLDTSTSVIAPHEWREGNSGAKFEAGDVLFARITPCLENGKTGLVRDLPGGVGFGSTEFIVMRGARAGPSFAYCLARSERFRANAMRGMSGASGRQRARTDYVSAFKIATPPGSELFDRFEAVTAPMLDAVGSYAKTNAVLSTSRDILLPRLISGQLSVAAAERELLEAA